AIPHQSRGAAHGVWHDASNTPQFEAERRSAPVFVVRMDGREVAFVDRQDAAQVHEQWNADTDFHALRTAGWSEDEIAQQAATGPEERLAWSGEGRVWDRVPDRRFVYYQWAEFQSDGSPAQPAPLQSAWIWEFEDDTYTMKLAEWMTGYRADGSTNTEAQARGTDEAAVSAAFVQACAQAKALCERSAHAELATAVA
ncbi:site-specific integrase, partial [Streptomyces sp. NPDC056405]